MHRVKALHAAALAVGLAIPATAPAATLHTPPQTADETLFCQVRNVGPKPIEVTIDTRGFMGEVMNTLETTLAPGGAASQPVDSGYATSCRFVVAGSAKNVRAVALYWNGIDYTSALLAR